MHSDATYENEDLEDFFENAALSLHWVGPDGTILRANKFELDFLGYEREEYEGHSIVEFHVDEDVIQDILARLRRGETIRDYEARLRAKDGSIKHVLINSNVRWDDDRFVHTRCFTRDITDRVYAEQALAMAKDELERKVEERTEELRRANDDLRGLVELRNRFVAMVSHELRTPLTSIAGFTTTMQRYWESLADGDKRKFLTIIEDESWRLSRLVNDLLTLSRLTSGKLETRDQIVDVAEAVDKALSGFADHDVVVAVEPGLVACADADHVHQILVNYVTNAFKYGAPPVEISAARVDGSAELRISDRGPGVRADLLPNLFEEFARPPAVGIDDPAHGTGLGLAIVRHLAHAQGGEAWYTPRDGGGAVFGVTLPIA